MTDRPTNTEKRGILEILGSGTSTGVPTMACTCPVCTSGIIQNRRLRVSVLIRSTIGTVLIDTSPDLRDQYFRAGQPKIDAILYTHHHFDHIGGFDDVRGLNFRSGAPIHIYGMEETITEIRRFFAYAFDSGNSNSSAPRVIPHIISPGEKFYAGGIIFDPLLLKHGPEMDVLGFKTGNAAYCTDCSEIPAESARKLRGVTNLVLDGLRVKEHPMHMTIARASEAAKELEAGTTWLTHLAHDTAHHEAEQMTPENIRVAFDGLKIPITVTAAEA